MVHVGALPGTPAATRPVVALAARAAEEARQLEDAGFDGVMIENMHDVPYLAREVGPEIIAGMTAVATAVRAAVSVPVGVQVLAGANRAAMAVATPPASRSSAPRASPTPRWPTRDCWPRPMPVRCCGTAG